jgi:hypothetical protein
MSEEGMENAVQQALTREGIDQQVIAAGQFNPRGQSGSLFAGGLAGSELGGPGKVAEDVGNVRVLELIHPESGSRIELEGNRVPLTHSKDVIAALTAL